MSILPAARCFEYLNPLLEQLRLAGIHLSRCNLEGELDTRGMRMLWAVIRTSAPSQRQQDRAHLHLQPTIRVPVNGEAKDLRIKGPRAFHILTQEHNIIEVANSLA